MKTDQPLQKILIVRLSSIGDIILTSPLIRVLRAQFPHCQIDFVIKEAFADLMSENPHISNLLILKKGRGELKKLKRQIKTEKYDLYLDIHKNFRSIYFRYGTNIKKVTTYSKEIPKRNLLVYSKINRYKNIVPVYQRYFQAVKHLGITYDGNGTEIHVNENDNAHVEKLLIDHGFEKSERYIVLCPGASFNNKQWSEERFCEVGAYYEQKGIKVILLGGPNDVQLCESMKQKKLPRALNFSGKLRLRQSAVLLKGALLVFANDSGMMHLSQSQKTPVVAIFGPTVKELGYFPLEEQSVVVEIKNLSCRPCTHNGLASCPEKHFTCLKDITVDMVTKAGDSLLLEKEVL